MEVRSVFSDISKAFDKVWHKGFLFALPQSGTSGKLLDLLSSFLSDIKQRVNLNGKMETQAFLKILFWNLCLVNDLSSYLSSRAKLFVDYTSLFPVTHDITTSANELNNDLKNINY